MSKSLVHTTGIVVALAVFLLGWMGCDNTIEPLAEADFEAFAIHGYLDMRTSYQTVRVEPLRPTILADPISLNGVRVSSVEVETGDVQVWRDSSVVLDSGEPGVVFVADFQPVLGRTYRLLVNRDGRPGAEAVALIPSKPPVVVLPPTGDVNNLKQHVVLQGFHEKPQQVFMNYIAVAPGSETEQTIRVAYGVPGAATENGWEFDVQLALDRFIVLYELGVGSTAANITIRGVSLEIAFYSSEWKEPDKEANLNRAYGFFGSIGVFTHGLLLDANSLYTLGFIDGQQGR